MERLSGNALSSKAIKCGYWRSIVPPADPVQYTLMKSQESSQEDTFGVRLTVRIVVANSVGPLQFCQKFSGVNVLILRRCSRLGQHDYPSLPAAGSMGYLIAMLVA